jgi:predicted kinase
MNNTLYLIRGLPGSGKSTFAKCLLNNLPDTARLFETDQLHTDSEGKYHFAIENAAENHKFLWQCVYDHLGKGYSAIVANTFITKGQILPYICLGIQMDAKINIITCQGDYGSIHDVPEEIMDKMRENWEDFSLEELTKIFTV